MLSINAIAKTARTNETSRFDPSDFARALGKGITKNCAKIYAKWCGT
jgi:hypothetical protein